MLADLGIHAFNVIKWFCFTKCITIRSNASNGKAIGFKCTLKGMAGR